MRRTSSTSSILYAFLYQDDAPDQPGNFQNHLARNLIPEIRIETATFYGSLDSIEARYPGLNYCHPPHRMRLGRFPHHARLFKAIDTLGITNQEVADLARWEGTLWARQRFERDEGVVVRDTTGDGIVPWVDHRLAKTEHENRIRIKVERAVKITQDPCVDTSTHDCVDMPRLEDFIEDRDHMDEDEDDRDYQDRSFDDDNDDSNDNHDAQDAQDSANLDASLISDMQNANHNLERRILAAFAARQQGSTIDIHPDLEAYLKELVENGHLLAASRPADGHVSGPDASSTSLQNSNSTLGQSTA